MSISNSISVGIGKMIMAWMRKQFPAYPVTVQSSPDDPLVICVRCFDVPEAQVETVENYIFDLQMRVPANSEIILLPMVKNSEITRQHYSEFLPVPPPVVIVQRPKYFFEDTGWRQCASHDLVPVGNYRTVPAILGIDIDKMMIRKMKPASTPVSEIPADAECALAA